MYGLFWMKNEIKIVYLSICLYIFVLLQLIYFYSDYIFFGIVTQLFRSPQTLDIKRGGLVPCL